MRVLIERPEVTEQQPVLSWPGRPTGPLIVIPSPATVRARWGRADPCGRLVLGDNLTSLAAMEPGSVQLVYLDPPFFSGTRYRHRVRLRDKNWEVAAFDDSWKGGLPGYLNFLEPRLRLIGRVLSESGSLYLHLDASAVHYVKVLLDEIFGAHYFSREIIWRIGWVSGFKTQAKNWVRNHDVLLYYARPGAPFHKTLLPHPEGYSRRGGGEGRGRPIEDVWTDIPSIQLKSFSKEKTGYATQKNIALLERIIQASSDPGDLVLDPFGGAGTTAVAAARLGRRFVLMDSLPLALHQSRRRLVDEGLSFEVCGAPVPDAGPVRWELRWTLAGPCLKLLDVEAAQGPKGLPNLEKIDAWWLRSYKDPRPAWFVHRTITRHLAPHLAPIRTESEPLAVLAGSELELVVVDLAGGHHHARVVVAPSDSRWPALH